MNNEETIIIQPKNNQQEQQDTKTPIQNEKATGNSKEVAAMTGAAVFGGAAGGATATTLFKQGQEEQEKEAPVEKVAPVAEEIPVKKEASTITATPKHEAKVEEVEIVDTKVIPITVGEPEEMDYTGNEGADPVVEDPTPEVPISEPQAVSNEGSEPNEVEVIGVFQAEGQPTAVLTIGDEVITLIDTNGNGEADVLVHDKDGNYSISEGEEIDISRILTPMTTSEEANPPQQEELMLQEEQMLQEQDTFTNDTHDQQDYNNDADLTFA